MDVIPSLPVLAAFVLAVSVLIITPGPDMALFLGKTLAQGRRAGLAAMLGAISGLVVHTMLAAFGLSALLLKSAAAFELLKLVGALYLLWLAFDALQHGSALTLESGPRAPEKTRQIYLKGLGINLLNPKIVLFFVTFLPQFVAADDPDAMGKLLFLGMTFIVLALPACALMIALADRIAATVKRSPRLTRIIDWLFAGVFAGFAAKLILDPPRN